MLPGTIKFMLLKCRDYRLRLHQLRHLRRHPLLLRRQPPRQRRHLLQLQLQRLLQDLPQHPGPARFRDLAQRHRANKIVN